MSFYGFTDPLIHTSFLCQVFIYFVCVIYPLQCILRMFHYELHDFIQCFYDIYFFFCTCSYMYVNQYSMKFKYMMQGLGFYYYEVYIDIYTLSLWDVSPFYYKHQQELYLCLFLSSIKWTNKLIIISISLKDR